MPRKPRVFIEGGIYHVYCRASRGEVVFADDTEASEFRGTLRSFVKQNPRAPTEQSPETG